MAGDASSAKRPCETENEDETAQGPAKRPRCDYDDTITVLVGPKERSFTAHKDVICFGSPSFQAACSTRWKGGQEKIIRLPTVEPSIFEAYMDWIYFGEIPSNLASPVGVSLIKLYVLGDMFSRKDLRNKVIEALQTYIHKTSQTLRPPAICYIWENTSEGSMLRKWAIDVTLLRSQKYFADHISGYPIDFVQQIAMKVVQQTSTISSAALLARSEEYQEADDEDA